MTVPGSASNIRPRDAWRWRGGPSFTVPDGSRIRLDRADLDVSQPWSCTFVARISGTPHGFTVAETGAFEWHVTYPMAGAEVTRTSYAGGELLVARRRDPAEFRAAWRGRWFELHRSQAGPVPAADGIIRVFDALRLTDTPEGMLVRPRQPGRVHIEPFRVAKRLPGVGQLRIELPGRAEVTVPRFRGHRARHGEIWRRPLVGGAAGRARAESLVLATPTAVAQLIPGPHDTPDADAALGFLEELNVTWRDS
ncbi:MAG: hypothetical protein ACRDRZ_06830 [Pseudonocardiaceae bacterium]